MHGGPDAKQHGNDTCAQNVEGAAGVTTRSPVDDVRTITE